jgi:hypothetical protein
MNADRTQDLHTGLLLLDKSQDPGKAQGKMDRGSYQTEIGFRLKEKK